MPHQAAMSGTITFIKEEQSLKAFWAMLVTLEGMVTLVRSVQPLNAKPMLVTPSPIITFFT